MCGICDAIGSKCGWTQANVLEDYFGGWDDIRDRQWQCWEADPWVAELLKEAEEEAALRAREAQPQRAPSLKRKACPGRTAVSVTRTFCP